MKGKKIWKKCLLFDICCICLLLGLTITGTGRGAELKQGFLAAAEHVEKIRQASSAASKDAASSEKKKIALTFDDGPNPQYTPEMLAALKERNVKATFFLLGEEVEKYPEIVKQIQADGHLIGNHSYKHEQLSKLPMEQACSQVSRTNELIYGITGVYPSYLRPPFGDWHEKLDGEVNMVEVLWDVDTLDT